MSIRNLFFILIVIGLFNLCAFSQVITATEKSSPADASLNRTRGKYMLDDIKKVLKQYYFDEKYRGLDLDEKIKTAKKRVDRMETNTEIFQEIAEILLAFDDSHTFFIPPNRSNRVSYGLTMQMIGPRCYVVSVKKGSDAEAKGIRSGDQILAVGEAVPTRESLWRINYLLYALSPQERIQLTLLGVNGAERKVVIDSTFKSLAQRKKDEEERRKKKIEEAPFKCHLPVGYTAICKLRTFRTDKKSIDKMMAEVNNAKNLILDLRGNGGGLVDTAEHLVSRFFDREVKMASFVTREKTREIVAKPEKTKVFGGELIVLVDSNSGSASEIFARIVQIEKRGRVIGDISSGSVMTSFFIPMINDRGVPGYQTFSQYAVSVTVGDVVMSDGGRLEKTGVIPDQQARPTARALHDNLDPVLGYAASQFGVTLSAEDAGKLNFLKAPDDSEDSAADDGKNETDKP